MATTSRQTHKNLSIQTEFAKEVNKMWTATNMDDWKYSRKTLLVRQKLEMLNFEIYH